MTGTLHLIKSVRPPVFQTPMTVVYAVAPKVGQAFLFTDPRRMGLCNLSTSKKITWFDGFCIIQTLNSFYLFVPEPKK